MEYSIKNKINPHKSIKETLHPNVFNSDENKNFLFFARIDSNKIRVGKFKTSSKICFTEGLFGKKYLNIFKRFH